MQAVRNDFMMDRTTLKLIRYQNHAEQFDLTFKFESLADHCFITLHQQVIEKPLKDGDKITNSEFIPQSEHLQ
jgi:hypothetical protein